MKNFTIMAKPGMHFAVAVQSAGWVCVMQIPRLGVVDIHENRKVIYRGWMTPCSCMPI